MADQVGGADEQGVGRIWILGKLINFGNENLVSG